MSLLAIRFSDALARGRRTAMPVATREHLLYTLLKKRAAASNAGADELEALLRTQILWALPTQYGDEDLVVELEAA
jgi:hypothetical protein